ncbi:MAG: DUF4494 family protein, partial [Bacteroidaceae bacterium]|nr:DUF4494 family protein [Bacteroidaceae bacterium]
IEPFMTGEFIVTDIKRARLSDLFDSDDLNDDRWFKARIAYISIDERPPLRSAPCNRHSCRQTTSIAPSQGSTNA